MRVLNGYRPLAWKEIRESAATGRLIIAVAVFAGVGFGAVALTYYLPDLVRNQAGSGITITVPKQTAVDAVAAYVKDIAQIPALAVILLAMGSIADERSSGVASTILYRPVSRLAYLLAKVTGQGLCVLAALTVGALAALTYIALLFQPIEVGPFAVVNLGLAVLLLDILAITLMASSLFRSGVAAGGAAFVGYLLLTVLPGFWSPLEESLPTAITSHAGGLMAGSWGGLAIWRGVGGGAGLALLCLTVALAGIARREV
ncbi:MAG: ABC transporter permease [Candidatus Dormibacteria bacterium]